MAMKSNPKRTDLLAKRQTILEHLIPDQEFGANKTKSAQWIVIETFPG